MKKNYLVLTVLLISTICFGQTVLLSNEFVDKTGYTLSDLEFLTSRTEYFTQTDDASDIDGVFPNWDNPLFAVQQLDKNRSIMFSATVPVGMTDLTFVAAVGEGDALDGLEDWDADDKAIFEYRFDSGSWMPMFTIEGTGTDTAPLINGVGDEVTSDFEVVPDFNIGNPGVATNIDVRVSFEGLTEKDEDLAIEYIALVDKIDLLPIPDITSPTEGNTVFDSGTTNVPIVYTIENGTGTVVISVNDVETAGSSSGGTYDLTTEDGETYEVEIKTFLGVYEIESTDITIEIESTSASIGKNEIEGFAVYPNPVNTGTFNIDSSKASKKIVKLYDVLGREVLNKIVQRNEEVDVRVLNSGVYILKVEEEGKTLTMKIVIK